MTRHFWSGVVTLPHRSQSGRPHLPAVREFFRYYQHLETAFSNRILTTRPGVMPGNPRSIIRNPEGNRRRRRWKSSININVCRNIFVLHCMCQIFNEISGPIKVAEFLHLFVVKSAPSCLAIKGYPSYSAGRCQTETQITLIGQFTSNSV